jgi:hypothetical protein
MRSLSGFPQTGTDANDESNSTTSASSGVAVVIPTICGGPAGTGMQLISAGRFPVLTGKAIHDDPVCLRNQTQVRPSSLGNGEALDGPRVEILTSAPLPRRALDRPQNLSRQHQACSGSGDTNRHHHHERVRTPQQRAQRSPYRRRSTEIHAITAKRAIPINVATSQTDVALQIAGLTSVREKSLPQNRSACCVACAAP